MSVTHHWLMELKEEMKELKVDGIPNIIRSERRLVQCMWAAILVLSGCVCVYLIINSVHEYQHFEVISTHRLVLEEESTFPTITICNNNPFSTDFAVQLIKQANLSFSTNPRRLVLQLESYFLNTTGSNMPDSVKRKLSDLDSMIIYCSFNNRECNSSHFQWIWHPYFYGCYRFNSGFDSSGAAIDMWKSTLAGRSFRFTVNLYAGMANQFSPYAARRSFNMFIQNASDYPYNTKPSPFVLTPITGTAISVRRSFFTQYNQWPFSYSECRVDENNELIGPPLADPYLFEEVVASNYTYTRDTCLNFCVQLMTTQVCGCNYYLWPLRVDSFGLCTTYNQTDCASNFYYNTFIVGDYIKENCLSRCPLECTRRSFSTSQSYFQFPTVNQAAYMFYYNTDFKSAHANQTDATVFSNLYYNMVSTSVFYESLSYSMTEEQPAFVMTELISAIGGHLHLFLGMSLLSFIEVIELGAFAFILKTEHAKKSKASTTKTDFDTEDVKTATKASEDSQTPSLKKHIKMLRIDGLPNIVKSKNVLFKLAWAIIFGTSFLICVWLIVGSVNEYLKYEVSTATRKHAEDSVIFPTITVCQEFPMSSYYAANLFSQLNSSSVTSTSDGIQQLERYIHNKTGHYMDDSQKRLLSDLSIISCTIGDRQCNASDFQWIWLPWFYSCYRFNAGFDSNNSPVDLIRVDSSTGSLFKFTLAVYTGLPDYWYNAGLVGVQSLRGLHVFIQNSTDYPLNLTPSPTLLNPGFGAEISVDRSFYSQFNKWPYAYSECRVNEHNELIGAPLDDTYLFEQVVAANYTYTRTTCIFFCAQVLTTELCGCNNYDLAMRVPGFDLCVSVNQSVCANNFFYLTFKADDFIRDNCLQKCPLECHQSTLSASFNYYKFPNSNDLAAIRSNQALASKFANETIDFGANLQINAVKFSVFYESPLYTLSEEGEKMTMDDMIGSIGGHLHLFLGMSLLSFIELLELMYIFVSTSSTSKKDTPSTISTSSGSKMSLRKRPKQVDQGASNSGAAEAAVEVEKVFVEKEEAAHRSTSIVHPLQLNQEESVRNALATIDLPHNTLPAM